MFTDKWDTKHMRSFMWALGSVSADQFLATRMNNVF